MKIKSKQEVSATTMKPEVCMKDDILQARANKKEQKKKKVEKAKKKKDDHFSQIYLRATESFGAKQVYPTVILEKEKANHGSK